MLGLEPEIGLGPRAGDNDDRSDALQLAGDGLGESGLTLLLGLAALRAHAPDDGVVGLLAAGHVHGGDPRMVGQRAADLDAAGGPVRDELLERVWTRADRWMDGSLEALIETYYEERQRELDGSTVRQVELVDALIDGQDVDASAAANALEPPLMGRHIGFLVCTSQVDDKPALVLRSAAEEMRKWWATGTLLPQFVGSRDLRCWIMRSGEVDDGVLAQINVPSVDDVSLAFGRPASGPDSFRSTHLDTRAAQQLAIASPLAPRVLHYPAVDLLCLCSFRTRGALKDGAA